MTISSMTGFARSDGIYESVSWHWEIRTVNGKSMDIRCRLPHGYEQIEPGLRKLFAKYISRGSCQVSLSLKESNAASHVTVNEAALAAVLKVSDDLVAKGSATTPSADGLLALKGVLEVSTQVEDEKIVAVRNAEIMSSLETTLIDLVAMRKHEGEQLNLVLNAHLVDIENLLAQVRHEVTSTAEFMTARVARQVGQLIDASRSLDEDRLYQEAIILTAKADITEELDRLDAHILAAREYLNTQGPIGRKLEFLIQEFNRETNTLCSKAATREITALGLDMKAVIDQLREQVLNIE